MGPLRLDPLDDARQIVYGCVVREVCRVKPSVEAKVAHPLPSAGDAAAAPVWGAVALLVTSILCSALVVMWCIVGQ